MGEVEVEEVTQPFNVWDVLTLGTIRLKDGVDVVSVFLGSFQEFKNMYSEMQGQVAALVDAAGKILESLENLWKEFVELGQALCSCLGIDLPDGYDDESLIDIDFDPTSNSFITSRLCFA